MNVTQSLFGLSPQAIQAQRAAELNQQALQFAQLTPMQQAQMGMFRAGSQLGSGIASAMGYEDPEIAQAKARQGLFGSLNMADPQALREAARNADPATAQALIAQALEIEKKEADIGAAKALAGQRSREANPIEQLARTGKYKPASLAKFAQSGKWEDLELTQPLNPTELQRLQEYRDTLTDPNKIAEVNKHIEGMAKGKGTTVTVGDRAANKYSEVVGKAVAEQDLDVINTANAAENALPKLEEALRLINEGNINTGIGRDLQDIMSRARAKFLRDQNAKVNVSDSQYLDSLLSSDVFAQIQILGIGARGIDTPAERDFLLSVITGTRTLDQDTLRRMTEYRRDAALRSINEYNTGIQTGRFNQFQTVTGRQLSPISRPSGDKPPLSSFDRN